MDNNAGRQDSNSSENQPVIDHCYGRPPPGLLDNIGNIGIHSVSSKQTVSPPPGLGPTPFFYPNLSNNVFFQDQTSFPPFYQSHLGNHTYIDNSSTGSIDKGQSFATGNNYGTQYQPQQQPQLEVFPNSSPRRYPLEKPSISTESAELIRSRAGVIEPIIENLMGSIGNSDGTYSHFGPANSGLGFPPVHHDNSNVLSRQTLSRILPADPQPQVINTDPFNSSQEWEFQRKMESRIRQKQQQSQAVPFGENKATNISVKTAIVGQSKDEGLSPSQSPKLAENPIQTSRPEPGKPSYLEMLTKNCPKDKTTAMNNIKQSGDTCDSLKGEVTIPQFHNQLHRKSFDGVTTSCSPPASNSSTASSSPISKPRTHQKGKENLNTSGNTSSGSSKSSTRRNTPVATPIHQQVFREDSVKKGQVLNESSSWITKLPGKLTNGKSTDKRSSGNGIEKGSTQFLEDLDSHDIDEGDKQRYVESNSEEKQGGSNSNRRKIKRKFSGNGSVSSELNNGPERRSSTSESKGSSASFLRRGNAGKEKPEKIRARKDDNGRNCAVRRFRIYTEQWITHLMKAMTWLWMLLLNVTVLSASLGYKLMEDLFVWWNLTALLTFQKNLKLAKEKVNTVLKAIMNFKRRKEQTPPKLGTPDEFLSVLGPDRNILLPSTGDDALKRLISVKGQDPYSILGVRSNSSEETIRRYYKKQAVLVHPDKNLTPGAEEAFKILAKAFEMVGEPEHRLQYHQQLLEAHAKERFIGEFGELFEELRKKMETVCSTIRCTKCQGRHKKNKTNRPVFAARYCSQCHIHHSGREGELWAEKSGMFSFTWQFYACMGNQIWEINEWGRCQRASLTHLKPNAHSVIYRLVSNGQQGFKGRPYSAGSSGIPNGFSAPSPEDDLLDPEMEDWDALFNNLYRTSTNATNQFANATTQKASSKNSATGTFNFQGNNAMNGSSGKKRKGKKK